MASSFGEIIINLFVMMGVLIVIDIVFYFFKGFFRITWKPHWIIKYPVKFVLMMTCMQLLHEVFNYPYFNLFY